MRPFHRVFTPVALTLALGCGSKSPTSPTVVTPTVTALAIRGADALLTGATADYAVTSSLTDGTVRPVTPAWTSSNPAVATINEAGRLEGKSHGSTTLTASSGGQTATMTIRVINNYGGTWEGKFTNAGCDAPPGFCAAMEFDFFDYPVSLAVSHSEADPGQVTAHFNLPNFSWMHATLSGNVTADGRLNLSGSSVMTNGDGSPSLTFTVGAWDSGLVADGSMKGRWVQRTTNVKPAYDEILANELVTMTRR